MKNFLIKLLGGYTESDINKLVFEAKKGEKHKTNNILWLLLRQYEKFGCSVKDFYLDYYKHIFPDHDQFIESEVWLNIRKDLNKLDNKIISKHGGLK